MVDVKNMDHALLSHKETWAPQGFAYSSTMVKESIKKLQDFLLLTIYLGNSWNLLM